MCIRCACRNSRACTRAKRAAGHFRWRAGKNMGRVREVFRNNVRRHGAKDVYWPCLSGLEGSASRKFDVHRLRQVRIDCGLEGG